MNTPSEARNFIQFTGLNCCGIREIYPIEDGKDARDTILSLCRLCSGNVDGWYSHNELPRLKRGTFEFCSLIFSQASGRNSYGYDLAKFIAANNLGDVVKGTPALNPNTGNSIVPWIWKVNRTALAKFWNNEIAGIQRTT